jgi:RNA polymerase sigma factor (sigma-70 family)
MSDAVLAALLRRRYAPATPDAALLLAYTARRDGAAFRALVERHGPLVLRLCRRWLRDADAEDAFQATFLVLARRAGSLRNPDALAAWLYGVCRRICSNARAAHERRRKAEARVLPRSPTDPTDELSARELLEALDADLDRLPERYRLPLLLVYWQGLTHAETAQRLGLTTGALHGRLVRGRAKLAARLRRRGLAPSALLTAPLASTPVPPDLLAATAALAADPWLKALPAPVLALAAAFTLSKLVRAVGLCFMVLAGAGLLGLAIAFGWGAATPTDPPAQAPAAQAVPAARGEPMTRIAGVVVDEAGRPVAGAKVNAIWFRMAPEDVTTAADGSFSLRIGGPTRSSEAVGASADGGARLGLAQFEESFGPTPAPVRIVLKPARALTVRVTDARRAPVEGAAVEIPVHRYGPVARAATDARGLSRFRLPADAEVYHVTALKPGVGFDVFENYRYWPPIGGLAALPDELSLTLDGARRVEIKAIDSSGRPVPGVALSPTIIHKRGKLSYVNLSGNDTALATTDAQGIARFDWIPKRIEAPIGFSLRPWDYSAADAMVIYPSAADATLTARIVRNVRVEGKVFLPDGAPAADVLVHASGMPNSDMPSQLGHFFTRTADDGSYAMNVFPDQTYTIALLDPRGAAPPLTGVNVRQGIPQEGLDLRMIPGALVRGRVTRGPEGKPAARERVNVELTHEGSRRRMQLWAMTDDGGSYAVRLSPGQYLFSAEFAGPGAQVEVNITGREEIVRDLVVVGGTRRLLTTTFAGVVVERVGAERRVVAGAEVREVVTGQTGFAPIKAVADAQGRFACAVGARPRLLYARSPDGTLAGYLEVPAAGEVEIPVAAAATVLGRVVDRDGRPAASRRVSLWVAGGAGAFEHRSLSWDLYTDEAGAFLFSGLVPGSAGQVAVFPSNDAWRSKTSAQKPAVREFKVRGPEPIVLPDLTVSQGPPAK